MSLLLVRLHLTGSSFSSVLSQSTAIMADDGTARLALKPARVIMFQMCWCTQITINLGASLQLPAEAALLCKDWLAIRARAGSGLRRTESANPAGVIVIKCCLSRRMTRTLLPPPCVPPPPCLVRGYHRRWAPFNCPPHSKNQLERQSFPNNRRQYFHQRSVSNHRHQYFVQKLTTLGSGGGAATLLAECQFAKGN